MNVKCPKCGYENDNKLNKCSQCGNMLKKNMDFNPKENKKIVLLLIITQQIRLIHKIITNIIISLKKMLNMI
ncbi:MAG: hypothetical protein LUG89_04645 [Methanosphaera sp.]|nr:hypothetical protein [Methanosphaera sp.]